MSRYSLRQRESGRWQARWYDPTGARRTKMFATKTEAKAFLDRASADKQRKDYIDDRDAERLFVELADLWLGTKVKRAKTLAGYDSLLRNHVLPFFGGMPVGSVRTSHVRLWLAEMQRKGRAPGTVRNAYRVLKPVLDFAVEEGCLRTNPCGPLRRDDLPRSQRTEMLFLNAEEVGRLVAAVPHPYDVYVQVAVWTGMRANEITALRMENVDLLRGQARVRASLSEVHGLLHTELPKTGEERTVPLAAPLVRVLREYVATQPPKSPRDYLFTMPDDSAAPVRHNGWFFGSVFRPAVRRAGLNPALRFHDLRHTCASLLIAQNVPAKVIQEHLGHASYAITMDRYGHLFPDDRQQAATAMERALAL